MFLSVCTVLYISVPIQPQLCASHFSPFFYIGVPYSTSTLRFPFLTHSPAGMTDVELQTHGASVAADLYLPRPGSGGTWLLPHAVMGNDITTVTDYAPLPSSNPAARIDTLLRMPVPMRQSLKTQVENVLSNVQERLSGVAAAVSTRSAASNMYLDVLLQEPEAKNALISYSIAWQGTEYHETCWHLMLSVFAIHKCLYYLHLYPTGLMTSPFGNNHLATTNL